MGGDLYGFSGGSTRLEKVLLPLYYLLPSVTSILSFIQPPREIAFIVNALHLGTGAPRTLLTLALLIRPDGAFPAF